MINSKEKGPVTARTNDKPCNFSCEAYSIVMFNMMSLCYLLVILIVAGCYGSRDVTHVR